MGGAYKDDILCPINIVFFSGSDVRSVHIFYSEVVDHKAKDDWSGLVLPQSMYDLALVVAVFS